MENIDVHYYPSKAKLFSGPCLTCAKISRRFQINKESGDYFNLLTIYLRE